jgi:hypothetical protein
VRWAALAPGALVSCWVSLGLATADSSGDSAAALLASPPVEAIQDPASLSRPGRTGLGVPSGSAEAIVAAASTNGIPSAALNAYQRAETVINASDKACHLPWQLIAAVGRVESDHGRYGGNTLGVDGVSRPGIFGIALDGKHQTQAISDTDAGMYDHDAVWDRAVGPMQFIPSTWSVVGVDADGDAKRDPQDIDDAALAAAVYLCSGPHNGPGADLSTAAGQRMAVFRYNHSEEYVDLVLSIMDAYLQGDYTSVPNYLSSTVTLTPSFAGAGQAAPKGPKAPAAGGHGGAGTPTGASTSAPADEPAGPAGPTEQPAGNTAPIKKVTQAVTEPVKTVTTLLTLPQAILTCTSLGYNPLLTRVAWNSCIAEYTT